MKNFFIFAAILLMAILLAKGFANSRQNQPSPSATITSPSLYSQELVEESERVDARELRDRHRNEAEQKKLQKALKDRAESGEGLADSTGP
ncbi:MAG: hypothetical protein WCG48_00745 [Candidatus Berkelbacteria bacterium]